MSRGRLVRTARCPCRRWFLALAVLARGASAQRTDTNVVTASADAFGVSIGVEALGIYGPSQVRGFDPLAAFNVRIEGMYVDVHGRNFPYTPLPSRLVQDTRIRVGPAAAGFPFPSPTGIVDFSEFDLDAHAPLAGGHCGVGGGVTRRHDEFVPGLTQYTTDVALLAACQASASSGSASSTDVPPKRS